MKKFQYFLFCSIFVLLSDFAFAIDEYTDKAVSPHFIINATQDTKVDFILSKQKIDASKLSVFNNLQPALTAILSLLIFGTPITTIFVIGGTLIIGGVFITQRG